MDTRPGLAEGAGSNGVCPASCSGRLARTRHARLGAKGLGIRPWYDNDVEWNEEVKGKWSGTNCHPRSHFPSPSPLSFPFPFKPLLPLAPLPLPLASLRSPYFFCSIYSPDTNLSSPTLALPLRVPTTRTRESPPCRHHAHRPAGQGVQTREDAPASDPLLHARAVITMLPVSWTWLVRAVVAPPNMPIAAVRLSWRRRRNVWLSSNEQTILFLSWLPRD